MILVTGGAGFIGSNLVNHLSSDGFNVVVLDKMTYAANKEFLAEGFARGNVKLIEGSIEDKNLIGHGIFSSRHTSPLELTCSELAFARTLAIQSFDEHGCWFEEQ